MSKIFLTGHNGFIGKHLYPKLINLGHEVQTDIRYLHSEGYDLVIHLAAITHIRCEFDHKLIESNILLTSEVFKTPSRVLYASSCSAAHLTNPYAYTKQWAEYCGMRHGNSLGMRFHNVYGNGGSRGIVWYLLQQSDGAELNIRGANLVRDYIYVDDVVNEIVKQMKPMKVVDDSCKSGNCRPERLINPRLIKNVGVIDVGTGVGIKTIDLISLFTKLSGRKFKITESEKGNFEPDSMISNNIVRHTPLEIGLQLTINNYENINTGTQL